MVADVRTKTRHLPVHPATAHLVGHGARGGQLRQRSDVSPLAVSHARRPAGCCCCGRPLPGLLLLIGARLLQAGLYRTAALLLALASGALLAAAQGFERAAPRDRPALRLQPMLCLPFLRT